MTDFPGTLSPRPRWVGDKPPLLPAHPWAGAWVWSTSPGPGTRYLVTLHGSDESASKELYWWQPRVAALGRCLGADLGVIAVQYLRSTPDGPLYLEWDEIHRLVDAVLHREVAAGRAAPVGHAFHGFSRGSANLYALAVLDGRDGSRWGTRFIANSGAWRDSQGPPPPIERELDSGSTTALRGTEFLVYYGLQDHDPGQNGVDAQTGAARTVRKLGGGVRVVVDPDGCHSAFETSHRPGHAFDALEWAFR